MLGLDPFCGAVFVFRSKRTDRIRLLVWDRTGMVLVHKRLEGGKFVCWPLRPPENRYQAAGGTVPPRGGHHAHRS
jgi:transposase